MVNKLPKRTAKLNKREASLKYQRTWGTSVGKDCINLDTTMSRWVGERLLFMAEHSQSYPGGTTYEAWVEDLKHYGMALMRYSQRHEDVTAIEISREDIQAAQLAYMFVAQHLTSLWD